MASSPGLHRAFAWVAVLTGVVVLGLSVGGVRAVDAKLAADDAQRARPALPAPQMHIPDRPARPATGARVPEL